MGYVKHVRCERLMNTHISFFQSHFQAVRMTRSVEPPAPTMEPPAPRMEPPAKTALSNRMTQDGVSQMVGGRGTLIPDDVIQHVIQIMRHYKPDMAFYIGQVTPAEIEFLLAKGYSSVDVRKDKSSINCHFHNGHWVTSSYNHTGGNEYLYDLLSNSHRVH
jgi:hypothetical protein